MQLSLVDNYILELEGRCVCAPVLFYHSLSKIQGGRLEVLHIFHSKAFMLSVLKKSMNCTEYQDLRTCQKIVEVRDFLSWRSAKFFLKGLGSRHILGLMD